MKSLLNANEATGTTVSDGNIEPVNVSREGQAGRRWVLKAVYVTVVEDKVT